MVSLKSIPAFLFWGLLFNYSCSLKQKQSNTDNSTQAKSSNKLQENFSDGLYVGFEYKGLSTDPVYPEKVFKFYHKGYLKIRGDSVFLDQYPVFIHEQDTISSASDGGFYYYSGLLKRNEDTVELSLKELFCDYCGTLTETRPDGTKQVIKRIRNIKGLLTENGIIIDSSEYKKAVRTENLTSEHPEPFLKAHEKIPY